MLGLFQDQQVTAFGPVKPQKCITRTFGQRHSVGIFQPISWQSLSRPSQDTAATFLRVIAKFTAFTSIDLRSPVQPSPVAAGLAYFIKVQVFFVSQQLSRFHWDAYHHTNSMAIQTVAKQGTAWNPRNKAMDRSHCWSLRPSRLFKSNYLREHLWPIV